MRRILLVSLGCLLIGLFCQPAWPEDLNLPGLAADSGAYARSLTARNPAGATPSARAKADAQIVDAQRKQDTNALITALETRIAAGAPSADQWLLLAQSFLRRTPPDAKHALAAAWQNFANSNAGAGEIPALEVMADALRALDRPAELLTTLQAIVDRAPGNTPYAQALAEARRTIGMIVLKVKTEPEADPPRACITFTVAPSRSEDFHPQDWVVFDPPVPQAAVTREAEQLCISGLPSGTTTRVRFRAGMPGTDGLNVLHEATLPVAMANRQPRVLFDTRLFVLPRTQNATIGVATVNLSSLKLDLSRLTERNIVPLTRYNAMGKPTPSWNVEELTQESGHIIWSGSAAIPNWQRNKIMHTALPLPEAMASAGPGLYALIARPGDGTPSGDIDATTSIQWILRTDLAPTVWRGSDGLTVQIRSYSDAKPKPGVTLHLMAHNNDVLAEQTTDADGVARFAAPLLHGAGGLAPVAVQAFAGSEDFASIDLTTAAFDLADRGVQGQADPGPLDAFLWTDRGIYRPGENVEFMALLRDHGGAPVDLPARVTVRRPNGQVFLEANPPRLGDASLHLSVPLWTTAPAGTWTAELRADPAAEKPIGSVTFRVDAFVPDRMAVEVGPEHGAIVPGTPYALPVLARFLYGAPAAGLSGKATLRLAEEDAPFPALAGYRFGLTGETYAPENRDLPLPDTGTDGRTTLQVAIPVAPDTTHALRAEIEVTVNDPSGHGSRSRLAVPLRPPGAMIGIKPLFPDDAVDAGTPAGFDIMAVDPSGNPAPLHARLRLVRERPDWRLVMNGALARYETVYRDEPLETSDITLPAGGPLHYSKNLDFGRYRLEVQEAGGLAATSMRFRAGWATSNSPDVPDKADVLADRRNYKPGDTAHIHISAPFAGEATVLIAGDRVFSLRNFTIPASGRDIDLSVDAAWGPGAYALVHMFRPGTTSDHSAERPARAIGIAWLGIDPATRSLDVTLGPPDRITPRQRITVPVHTAPGAWLTLAAVDEGVLRLTNFVSPDPTAHFLGRRLLSVDIRDDWGRLILPPDGGATVLRQGGDEGNFALPEIPQKVVALFSPPMQAGADGTAQVPVNIPDFAGQIRLMVVAWQGSRIGAANANMIVRDPLVAEPLLPRFLAPGDQARVAMLLHNLDLPAGQATVDLTVDGPVTITGPTHLVADLGPNAQAVATTQINATGSGRGVLHFDINFSAGFHVKRDTAIPVRPARPAVSYVSSGELAPGAALTLTPNAERFVAGTWLATATFGAPIHYDAAALIRALAAYPLYCLEQAVSRGLPLALLSDGSMAGDDRAGRLQHAVENVLERQRYDGGFGLWSATGEAQPWLSAYAVDFLTRARAAGAAVPESALKDAIKFLSDASDGAENQDNTPAETAAETYRLYDLARAGQGRPGYARVLAERLNHLPTPLARAQVGAALALAHDQPRAEAAFAAALDAPDRNDWHADYGTALRDQAAIAVLLKESGLLRDRLSRVVATLPGGNLEPKDLQTQEQAWAAAAAAVLRRDGEPTHIAINAQAQAQEAVLTVPITGVTTVSNLAQQTVWQTFTATGVPQTALPASRNKARVTRRFFNLDGSELDLDHLKQNTLFVLLLEGRAEDGQDHDAMVLQGLPAGWEIAGRFASGKVPGLDWLGELSPTEAEPAGDDRYGAVLALSQNTPGFRVAVKLRAVTPGNYEIPGAEFSDMYRPAIYARQTANRINVLPP